MIAGRLENGLIRTVRIASAFATKMGTIVIGSIETGMKSIFGAITASWVSDWATDRI
jgi:hypothetical protein